MAKRTTQMQVVASADPIALMSPQTLKAQIKVETEKRELITQFIAHHLKPGTDYGKIHVMPKNKCEKARTCTNPYHFSKDTLFKPGAEKFCSLFKLRAAYVKDTDTWEMLGSNAGTVCYICHLYTASGVLVGEGRGVSSVTEKENPNTAVKIAQKRAKLDAVLSTGALSDFFTQDFEDEDYQKQMRDGKPPKEAKPTKEQLFDHAKHMIAAARNPDILIEIDDRIQKSKQFTTAQKKELHQLVSGKIDKQDHANA